MCDEDELERVAKSPMAVPVWVDNRPDEVDVYYVSPRWYLQDEHWDFISEYEWKVKSDYWNTSARYAEAIECYEAWTNWFSNGGNKQGG